MGALLLCQGGHGLRSSLGQQRLGLTQGRGDAGDPFRPRLGELLEVLGTLAGVSGATVFTNP